VTNQQAIRAEGPRADRAVEGAHAGGAQEHSGITRRSAQAHHRAARRLNPSSFNAAQLNVLKHSIDQAMDQFAREAAIDVSTFQSQAASLGAQTASAPLAATGLEASAFGQVSRTTLAIAQGYSADLITAMSKDAALKINSTIQRAFLGGQQMTDIIDQLGRALNNGESAGLFGPIAERATSIATNEILRVHSMAAQARMSDLKERHPDLLKMWHHTPAARVPRMSHIAADGQVRDVNEPFDVDGEQLMFPRDPNGSAENTINCHCGRFTANSWK
jgi:hypothetical protein